MITTTREQRVALKRVYDRAPIFETAVDAANNHPMSYLQFLETVQPAFGCDGAITVPWCGMWLCIETDGYTHS